MSADIEGIIRLLRSKLQEAQVAGFNISGATRKFEAIGNFNKKLGELATLAESSKL